MYSEGMKDKMSNIKSFKKKKTKNKKGNGNGQCKIMLLDIVMEEGKYWKKFKRGHCMSYSF